MCRVLSESWGYKLEIPNGHPTHGIIVIDKSYVYIIWVSGATNDLKVNVTPINGGSGEVQATCDKISGHVRVVAVPNTSNHGITYIGK